MVSENEITFAIKVLYVEDEDAPRELLARYIKNRVKELVVAEDGIKALKKLYSYTPDLLITDYSMPHKNGLELIKSAKELLPNLKTIITTAHSDTEMMLSAIEIGVDKFLLKPIKLDALNSALKSVSDAVKLKNELDATTKSLKEMVDALNSSAIVSKTDPKGIITYVNDYFCKVSGYSKEELLGNTHAILRHPDMPKSLFEDLWKTILSKKVWHGRIKNKKKNGDFYIVETTIVPILGEDKKIKEFFSFRTDVTEAVLMEQKLIQKEKEHLQKLNKAKDDLLVIFTHELRTPLNAIINLSSSCQKKLSKQDINDKEEILEYLSMINTSGKDMLNHITNMIDVIKLKTKKMSFNLAEFALDELIDGVILQFQELIKQKNINCIFNKEHIIATTDAIKFKQIVSNLLSNAIKYSNGQIAISLTKKGSIISVVIEDNGSGFKDVKKLGELFEQNDEDVIKRSSSGFGVGLTLCKLLCQELKYKIEFSNDSSLGGAMVKIEIDTNRSINNEKDTNS